MPNREHMQAALLDYYQHTAARAEAQLARQTRIQPATAAPAAPPARPAWPTGCRRWPGSGPSG